MSGRILSLMMAGVIVLTTAGMQLAGFQTVAQAAEGAVEVDIGYFYDRLAVYGDWRQHNVYGWVWHPRGMSVDWRPYTYGHWVYTDDYGWLWNSDLDWGWACFHYGRWNWDGDFGWYWVPGYHWGPAWVAWRRGPDLVGWVALPPQVGWQPEAGLVYDGFSLSEIPARRWVFVPAPYFDAPRIREHEMLSSRNVAILPGTRNVTRLEIVDGRIVDLSISLGWLEGTIHRPVQRYHVRHVDSAAAMRLPRERDGEISIFSPGVRRGPAGLAPPRPGEIERRQEAERAQMQERQRAERARQEQQHQAERARQGQQVERPRQEQPYRAEPSRPEERTQAERAAPRADMEQLQQQQEAERQALRNEHERQSRELENRQRRERQIPQRLPQARAEGRKRSERPEQQR